MYTHMCVCVCVCVCVRVCACIGTFARARTIHPPVSYPFA